MKENILITGGAGFIGSNYVNQVFESGRYNITVLDSLTYAGNKKNISCLEEIDFVEGSICNKTELKELFLKKEFTKIIHFAAESHVDNSIFSPANFIETNINGTFNLLEEAKSLWLDENYNSIEKYKNALFLHISTDEVYGTLSIGEKPFNEDSPYRPNSPYSASKASSDLIVRSYFETYHLPIIITNCSNNFGPCQHEEKLIPKIIKCCLDKKPIPIYGNGKNIRDWIYVKDHCNALFNLMNSKCYGETFCLGASTELQNIQIAKYICNYFNSKYQEFNYLTLIEFVTDRLGHDLRYAIDSSKYNDKFSEPISSHFEKNLILTIKWYEQFYSRTTE